MRRAIEYSVNIIMTIGEIVVAIAIMVAAFCAIAWVLAYLCHFIFHSISSLLSFVY